MYSAVAAASVGASIGGPAGAAVAAGIGIAGAVVTGMCNYSADKQAQKTERMRIKQAGDCTIARINLESNKISEENQTKRSEISKEQALELARIEHESNQVW